MANERMSDEAVRSKTGKTWPEWYEILDKAGARELDHKEIVALTQHHGVGSWWGQMVTVTYEQFAVCGRSMKSRAVLKSAAAKR